MQDHLAHMMRKTEKEDLSDNVFHRLAPAPSGEHARDEAKAWPIVEHCAVQPINKWISSTQTSTRSDSSCGCMRKLCLCHHRRMETRALVLPSEAVSC
jgi:hypothetical protein